MVMSSQARQRAKLTLAAIAYELVLAACALPASPGAITATPNPAAKLRNAPPDSFPIFARITFTPGTTYDQAIALLPQDPYPWSCDDPATPIPPPPSALRASFDATHTLLVSYPQWDRLTVLARSPRVALIEGTALYPCP